MDKIKLIEDLHRLKADGVITDREFTESKADILRGIAPAKGQGARSSAPTQSPGRNTNWMFLPIKKYGDFTGRARRMEFWLFQILFLIPLGMVGSLTEPDRPLRSLGTAGDEKALLGICGLIVLGLLVPQIAVTVRRFHDQNQSGWLALLYVVPVVGWLAVFVMMALPGTVGRNQYGNDPIT